MDPISLIILSSLIPVASLLQEGNTVSKYYSDDNERRTIVDLEICRLGQGYFVIDKNDRNGHFLHGLFPWRNAHRATVNGSEYAGYRFDDISPTRSVSAPFNGYLLVVSKASYNNTGGLADYYSAGLPVEVRNRTALSY